MSKMTLWRVRPDAQNYQSLRLAEPDAFYARFPRPFAGLPMAKPEENWSPVECLVSGYDRPAADFSALLPGMFVISQRVCDSPFFMACMNRAAEIGDISVNGERRYMVNVVQIFNALDRGRSALTHGNDGSIATVERYAFYPERIGADSSLFKLPETATREMLAWYSSEDDPELNFPATYDRCGFTGLQFDLLAEEEME